VEDEWEVGAEARGPALAETRTRPKDAMKERTRFFGGWIVKVDSVAAGDQVDLGAGFIEQACEIGGGGPGADDGDGAAVESADFGVLRAMGDKVFGQIREIWRDVVEVGDADGDDDAASEDDLAGLRGESETFWCATERGDVGLFEAGDEALLELHSVGDEGFDGDGIDDVGVSETALLAEMGQRKGGTGVVEAGGETKGFEQGATGHVVSPARHGSAEDAKGHVAGAQVGCDG